MFWCHIRNKNWVIRGLTILPYLALLLSLPVLPTKREFEIEIHWYAGIAEFCDKNHDKKRTYAG